jgi:hypothetical protein
MQTQTELDQESRRILWACVEFVRHTPRPDLDKSVCFRWVLPTFRKAFGCDFHQTRLKQLAADGFLCESDSVRGGKRRYYTVTEEGERAARC